MLNIVSLMALVAISVLAGCSKQEGRTGDDGRDQTGPKQADGGDGNRGVPNAGGGELKLSGAKCAKHGAPQKWCFICDASLRDKGRLWCKEHDRYEDRCFICHPEAQDKKRLFCKEHSLYEDECFLCHPELKTKDKPSAGATPSAP